MSRVRTVTGVAALTLVAAPSAAATAETEPRPLRLRAPAELAAGLAIPVSGSGAAPSAAVRLERRTARRWVTVARAQSKADGRFRFTYAPHRRAPRYLLRAESGDRRSPTVRTRSRLVTFAAVGDVNLGDVPGAGIERHGPQWPWQSVGPVLRDADVALANLECAVSLRGAPVEKQFRFRGLPSSLRETARTGGIDIVNLANNHVGDYGGLAFADTLRYARRFGIETAGAGFTIAGALKPAVVTRLGLRIAVVGFSEIGPFQFATTGNRPGTAWATDANVGTAVRRASSQADLVIATFHWGIERAREPSPRQRQLAGLALEAGAAAVIGAHPHVLQPIRRPARGRLIAYSLGNFVFGAHSPGTQTTGILTLALNADGVATHQFRRATIVVGRPILR